MTSTVAPTSAVGHPPRRARRRHRVLIPLGLALLLIVATLVAHAVDQPDPTDPGFLSPVATGDDGGSRLAEALRGQGMTVRRETDTLRALLAARPGPATLFVPAPELVHPDTVAALDNLPAGSRLVLVDPSRRVLEGLGLPVTPGDRRWATRATSPDADGHPCALPEAARAGTAAADRQRYATPASWSSTSCYAGGVVRVAWRTEVVVIGAGDPFRNDRIDEYGNRALATGLLGGPRPLVWLDLDGPAPAPTFGDSSDGEPAWSPSPDGSAGPKGDGQPGSGGQPGRDGDRRDGGQPGDDRAGGPQPHQNPLWAAFPVWFWALLVQLALAGLLMVLWRARRLGPPVPEPLPVTVRSAETVLGRARLYRRAGARGPVAETLRAAALDRLLPRLNLPPDAPPAEVAARVAARTGLAPDRAAELLHGDEPATDQELLELARALDRLTRTVATRPDDHPTEGDPR
ncbi:DUF4350 domain-containing protein [Micromonospora inositola]|uniref:DUF4350 domain-containing protein n=1 Tax=Micromonospora inositola TaxID=47865 RepID=A0A1C5H4H2_9ACTN|nr:DUF4350 domain-containing protein [Micromonospora inositola]SCG40908.1 hypothetical protein GA0070613_0820 [Micromonospora inositola]